MAGFAAVAHGQFIFRGGQAQRADHHGSQGVGEFAFEHRAFAGDDAVIGAHFAVEKRRKHVRQVHLPRAREISARQVEILRHHAEVDVLRAEHVPHLPDHFLHAHVAAGIARAVVAGKEQAQFFGGGPALAEAEHPAEAGDFDQRADPRHQKEIGHARTLPAAASRCSPASAGQGLAGYLK